MKPAKNNISNYKVQKDKSLTFLTISVLALFVGIITSLALYSITLIDFYTVSKFWVGFTIIGFLIPLKYYQKWFDFIKYEMIIFNVIGVGPFLMALFLTLNYLIPIKTTTHKYKIEKIYFEGEQHSKTKSLILEGNAFSGEKKITELDNTSPFQLYGNPYLKLTLSNGIFGFDVIKNKEFSN